MISRYSELDGALDPQVTPTPPVAPVIIQAHAMPPAPTAAPQQNPQGLRT
ncbi:hypothetical protein PHLCEN_2v11827 [Hermanssonia centrifuga]|uniref:Uncharacterized protein n=1 Tax=Hermanssonia centrifuga TaxID=98765 RepID=A0A2R6NIM4_9APHY|nr:hypothetical protein PHLCEN_2v11827 [Hermanssonia centrifuga]